MQTLLAYAFDRDANPERVARGLRSVDEHYRPLWPPSATRHGADRGRVGVSVWDREPNGCTWPVWHDDGDLQVATLHVPVGYEAVVGDIPPAEGPASLARALLADPDRLADLTPPWILTVVDHDRLHLLLDLAGLARLFELRTPEGWIWSNRPAAAMRFAAAGGWTAPRADPVGWRYEAATAFFMADSSPVDGMTSVMGGTHLSYDPRTASRLRRRVEALSVWLRGDDRDPLGDDALDEVADALARVGRSTARLWPQLPAIGLSGGRDSRMVAAAFLAGGVDVRVFTTDMFAEETDTARELVRRYPQPLDHRVAPVAQPAADDRQSDPALVRAAQWHRIGEGFRPPSFLFNRPPARLPSADQPVISGAGGEMCHGRYYPDELAEFDAPAPVRLQRLTARLVRVLTPYGISAAARETVTARVREVVREIRSHGVDDLRVLDCFYLVETMRRWGTAGEPGTVCPLMHPAFVRASLALTPEQRRTDALPRAVTERLVPSWAGVPFVGAAGGRIRRRHLWEEPDRDRLTTVFASPQRWRDAFDVAAVQEAWRNANGSADRPREWLLQRVVWRAAYDDFLAEVAGAQSPDWAATPWPDFPAAPPPRDPAPAVTDTSWTLAMRRRLRRTPMGAVVARAVRRLRAPR